MKLVYCFLASFLLSSFLFGQGETKTFVETQPRKLDYLLHLPSNYEEDKERRFPLVVFLHGAGERGSNVELVAKHGPPKMAEAGRDFPFILVSPQCPADSWWTEQPVMALIDSIEKSYRVDSEQIILTGLSMGGYGTWHFASLNPKRFAAIAPVCGGGLPYHMRKLDHLPIWIFHGAKDQVIPLIESERLAEALKKFGNQKTKFTIYPEADHDSWTEAYATEELYEWLLSHKQAAPK